MSHHFRPGDLVYWWKRITREGEHPCRAEVVAIGSKRIKIAVKDPDGGSEPVIRHVAADCLQPVGIYHEKARCQGPELLEPAASWGRYTCYAEIGEDLRLVRQVNVYENGSMLSYDRRHWVDEFGMLGDARINRNRKQGRWGQSEEITAAEFESVWKAARRSPVWKRQQATAKMSQWGAVPMWFTSKDRRPPSPRNNEAEAPGQ
jgi:hypothetical protein